MNDEDALLSFLQSNALWEPGESVHWMPLTGGISSDIYRVDLPRRTICIKRSLRNLKTKAHWTACISRSHYEWRWLQYASALRPKISPRPLAHDSERGIIAMEYLTPDLHHNWKKKLLDGIVDISFGIAVATSLGTLHRNSANKPELLHSFGTPTNRKNFFDLRIEPYFRYTAQRHPDLATKLCELGSQQIAESTALIHGDVSPKNILAGPDGPLFLDAECATFADPVFDVAFCMNHILLKSLVRPANAAALLQMFLSFSEAYFRSYQRESNHQLEKRIAKLLPALLLARIDGKSPVEYLRDTSLAEGFVRQFSRSTLIDPCHDISHFAEVWMKELARAGHADHGEPQVFRHQ